jgi:hypothetical protein
VSRRQRRSGRVFMDSQLDSRGFKGIAGVLARKQVMGKLADQGSVISQGAEFCTRPPVAGPRVCRDLMEINGGCRATFFARTGRNVARGEGLRVGAEGLDPGTTCICGDGPSSVGQAFSPARICEWAHSCRPNGFESLQSLLRSIHSARPPSRAGNGWPHVT